MPVDSAEVDHWPAVTCLLGCKKDATVETWEQDRVSPQWHSCAGESLSVIPSPGRGDEKESKTG